jgi:ADP-ribosylglycohydrolase
VVDRYRGALLGLAVGDALGTTLEFQPPGSFEPIDDMVGGGCFRLSPGQWTDDTSMALCLAESLIDRAGFEPVDQLERYVRWWRDGHLSSTGDCFDIGITTRRALERFQETHEPYCGSDDPHTAGNGSIMRLAPVPLFFAADAREAIERSGDSSRTTHAARTAVDACRYLGAVLVGAVHGVPKASLLAPGWSPVAGYWDEHPLAPEVAEVAAGSFAWREPPEIRGGGYVVRSLEAALWALHRTDSFRQGALAAVNLGDDADTTGAVYGQLAGALYGVDEIPVEWRSRLALRETIERLADGLRGAAM